MRAEGTIFPVYEKTLKRDYSRARLYSSSEDFSSYDCRSPGDLYRHRCHILLTRHRYSPRLSSRMLRLLSQSCPSWTGEKTNDEHTAKECVFFFFFSPSRPFGGAFTRRRRRYPQCTQTPAHTASSSSSTRPRVFDVTTSLFIPSLSLSLSLRPLLRPEDP